MGKDQELLEAARNGNYPVVEKILSLRTRKTGPLASLRRGPGPNVQDGSGYSALHHAALNGHKDVVQLLLQYDALTNICDQKGSSPLHLSAWTGNADIVKMLLTHEHCPADVSLLNQDRETPLHCAAQHGHHSVVSLLLEHGADPAIRNNKDETPLDLASTFGRLDSVELLVRSHPELIRPFIEDEESERVFMHTPLHAASRNGHKYVVEVLLSGGFDVNARTPSGTALHEAAMCGKVGVVKTLLNEGIDPDVRDAGKRTALDLLNELKGGVTQEIAKIIKGYSTLGRFEDKEENRRKSREENGVPPRSPYENTQIVQRGTSSEHNSPSHWNKYDAPPRAKSIDIDMLDGVDESLFPAGGGSTSKSLDSSNLSEEFSDFSSRQSSCLPTPPPQHRDDADVQSLSSSSIGAASPTPSLQQEVGSTTSWEYKDFSNKDFSGKKAKMLADGYITMHPGGSSTLKMKPPKKPPRRSMAPPSPIEGSYCNSHPENYEYLYHAHSGIDYSKSSEDLCGRDEQPYGTICSRHSVTRSFEDVLDGDATLVPNRSSRLYYSDGASHYAKIRTLPVRKRNCNSQTYQNIVPNENGTYVSSAYIRVGAKKSPRPRSLEGDLPLSPTKYQQPPTPEHPPPTAKQAERSIHERMRPLSQESRRKSRDMETETEEEWFRPRENSSCSLSNTSGSLSDKSVSTDNIEEVKGDRPFAGLYKGSVPIATENDPPKVLERPKTLQRENGDLDALRGGSKKAARTAEKTGSLSIMSPFDEKEEWNKIFETLAPLEGGLPSQSNLMREMEKEFDCRLALSNNSSGDLKLVSSIREWLTIIGIPQYEDVFMAGGFDDVQFLYPGVLEEEDLKHMKISNVEHQKSILESLPLLPSRLPKPGEPIKLPHSVKEWLASINLESYLETFEKNLYADMEKVCRIWEVELSAVLEIKIPGHKKRIMASLGGSTSRQQQQPNIQDLDASLTTLMSNINDFGNDGKIGMKKRDSEGLVREKSIKGRQHSYKKSKPAPPPPNKEPGDRNLPIRDPQELLVGVPSTLTTKWRHPIESLINGSCEYASRYLGSTLVKELRGTESTRKSIQKLKGAPSSSENDISLNISYQGVRFVNLKTKELICEHAIRNIHCACQDSDELRHFAYITRDLHSGQHYCHVFVVTNMELATEIILTLGQAFEVAYQIALKERPYVNQSDDTKLAMSAGHSRSRSVHVKMKPPENAGHSRSHSDVPPTILKQPCRLPLEVTEEDKNSTTVVDSNTNTKCIASTKPSITPEMPIVNKITMVPATSLTSAAVISSIASTTTASICNASTTTASISIASTCPASTTTVAALSTAVTSTSVVKPAIAAKPNIPIKPVIAAKPVISVKPVLTKSASTNVVPPRVDGRASEAAAGGGPGAAVVTATVKQRPSASRGPKELRHRTSSLGKVAVPRAPLATNDEDI